MRSSWSRAPLFPLCAVTDTSPSKPSDSIKKGRTVTRKLFHFTNDLWTLGDRWGGPVVAGGPQSAEHGLDGHSAELRRNRMRYGEYYDTQAGVIFRRRRGFSCKIVSVEKSVAILRSARAANGVTTPVSKIGSSSVAPLDPMKRGLKLKFGHLRRVYSTVAPLDPMKRGLKLPSPTPEHMFAHGLHHLTR